MHVALLGAGGYGTALLRPLTDNGHCVRLWDRDADLVDRIRRLGYNPRYPYLHEFRFPGSVAVTADLREAVTDADAVVCAVSMGGLKELYLALAGAWPADRPLTVVGISKGITVDGRLPDELAGEALAGISLRYAHLAGPAFAQDLIGQAPVALVAASEAPDAVATCRTLFGNGYVWVYASRDIRGIEAAAAVRTILSVVFGGVAGYGQMSRSTKAFIFSRAQAEIARFGMAMGGRAETFMLDSPCAPATVGDLYLCDDPGSRNWRLGNRMSAGVPVDAALRELQGVAESVSNSAVVHRLAEAFRRRDPAWELPWCEGVYRVCHEGVSVQDVIDSIRLRADRLRAR